MKRINIEVIVGLFMLLGLACFGYLAIKLGDVQLLDKKTYTVTAAFNSVSGLKEGAVVELAGVRVGKVAHIQVDPQEYQAIVSMDIQKEVQFQEDSIASVRTSGIIGDKFVDISPGGAEEFIRPGGMIEETESSISLEQLVSKKKKEKE